MLRLERGVDVDRLGTSDKAYGVARMDEGS